MRVPWEPSSCAACRRLRSKFRSRTGISAATRFGSMGIDRKGRSCTWPPSRGVTSKSPMHAGVASSLRPHARVTRRARQRRRVYQSGKGRATNRGGPGRRQAHRWPVGSARDLPRPVPHQRPGPAYEVSFAGRSAVFRRRRFGPALLREAPRCSCPAVACGDRGVSESTLAAGLLFGADGVAVTVSVDRTAGDASLATATTSNASTVSASMQDLCRVPSCPANIPEVSRGRRLPCLDVRSARNRASGASGSIRPRRPLIERHGASVPTRVHLPPASPPYSRIVRPRFGTWASPSTSYGCRARTGFPPAVWSPSLSGWLPTTPPQGGSNMGATIAPAPKRHQNYLLITLAAAALRADLAPRHYRIAPPGDMPPKAPSAASGRRSGSDGDLRLRPRPSSPRHSPGPFSATVSLASPPRSRNST